jgi:hypothetical protein
VGFLRRLRGRPEPGPPWASSLDSRGFARFEALLGADMRRRGWACRREADGLHVEAADLPGGRQLFGLSNLAQVCGQIDPGEWAAEIRAHFDTMAVVQAIGDDLFADFERCRPNLRLRLMTADARVVDALKVIRYPIARGLTAVLVLDLPTSVATIPRDEAEAWPPVDELFRIALDNIRAEPAPERRTVEVRGARIVAELGGSFFVASRLLMLREELDLEGADGVLVAIPTRHALLAHVIRDRSAVPALPALALLARDTALAGPGAITSAVYWWHAGALTEIPVAIGDDSRVTVEPPAEFRRLLDEVAARP